MPMTLYCSFCQKSQREVKILIAGHNVFICDECVDVCVDLVLEKLYPDPNLAVGRIMVPGDIGVESTP